MIDYNYEIEYKEYENEFREYHVPIKKRINNRNYKKQQLEFIRNLFPLIKKKIKINPEDMLDLDILEIEERIYKQNKT